MKKIFNHLLKNYNDQDLYIKKKSEYTILFLSLMFVYALVVAIHHSLGSQLNVFIILFLLLYFSVMSIIGFMIYLGRLELAMNIFIVLGFIRGITLFLGGNSIKFSSQGTFEFYVAIFLSIFVIGITHIKKYQLYSSMSFYVIISNMYVINFYKLYKNNIVNEKMYNSVFYSNIGVFVFLVMITRLVKIVLSDIEKTSQLEELSKIDYLTGLYNRRKYNDILKELNLYSNISIIILDIDYFKSINDQYGHCIGDNVLKDISNLLKDKIDDSNFIIRWGGEEFIIFLKDTSLGQAKVIAEKLRKKIAFKKIENTNIVVTASFGVAKLKSQESFEQLIERADKALYQAKNKGRNQVAISD